MTDHLMDQAIKREVAKPTKEKTRAQLTQEYSHARPTVEHCPILSQCSVIQSR